MPKSAELAFGYVKVGVRSRSPKLWGWSLHHESTGDVVQRSEATFPYSEDAWLDGQRALAEAGSKLGAKPADQSGRVFAVHCMA